MQNPSQKLSLTTKVFIGMAAGFLIGSFLNLLFDDSGDLTFSLMGSEFSTRGFLVDGVFNVLGAIFIASLKMMVVPLVFVSLVCGTCNMSDPAQLGRLGGKSIGLYIFTTAIAITIAISLALLVQPGVGQNIETGSEFVPKEAPSLAQVIIDIVPTNPISAMADGNMLQIIVFALLFGIAMGMSGESGKRLAGVFNDLNDVVMKIVTILMNLAPYGVFALMAKIFATMGFMTIFGLAKYFFLLVFVLGLHAFVVYPVLLKVLTGLNPIILLKKMRETVLFAISTSSSSATLPVTLETARKKLGVHNSVASFTIPLGSTINMDGTAIMQGIATVFIAQAFNVDLTVADYLMVILTATLASIGTAGVPGVGLIMLAMVLQQVGLPVQGIALIIGVDRLLDMLRTAVNVTGDATVACIVAKSEDKLHREIYNDMQADLKEENISTADFHQLGKD